MFTMRRKRKIRNIIEMVNGKQNYFIFLPLKT